MYLLGDPQLIYRADIDGLRALAVLLVIFFHTNTMFTGGYVGVDVFFVISGYLITTLLISDIENKKFTFLNFYQRRAARLLPALSITLLLVLIFGFFFYTEHAFDSLGKDVFFSSIGAANILFAQGLNYFVQDVSYKPLIHLWSLGVEEQFYLLWPFILLVTVRLSSKYLLGLITLISILSVIWSEISLLERTSGSYFLPHYRAFELLIGAFCSVLLLKNKKEKKFYLGHTVWSLIGLGMIFMPSILLSKASYFPGINALVPCIGASLLILNKPSGIVKTILENRYVVLVGLISYPLYLYHQPIISFVLFFQPKIQPISLLIVTLTIALPASWITYKFVEKPIRNYARFKSARHKKGWLIWGGLVAIIPVFALSGFYVAKSNGFPQRFTLLNPFAGEISKQQKATFHENYKRGFQISDGRVLFVGDSLLQQYVNPITQALSIEKSDIDLVTRGGCVLLKGVEFEDKFSDISCNALRENLYNLEKHYEVVFLSQSWKSYSNSVLNFDRSKNVIARWSPFIESTIDHFKRQGSRVVIIGPHPMVEGIADLQPTIFSSREKYQKLLSKLLIADSKDLIQDNSEFVAMLNGRAGYLSPSDLFCHEGRCVAHNGQWSFFSDAQHLSAASTDYLKAGLESAWVRSFSEKSQMVH
ncbi:acyltransferase family protein [Marinobacterium lutimaris]|uniref:Peptidoglycan/LPS O-acetylase OafA/YrhL, contains acyltransferase and SGNH-hydrolase domains n=1 Tax=Marinobacterium lutimaris TaxID=568106 RepID=A0A1H6AKL9_9GAMM|nr:acyltransferase family protein [Marinobacterium lutimaris]SEG49238.1 Peptidoglycan/LPS O-acetylase OafA/YrhL, contains acyltransferase and SGNH-hydrolase domains [Marinobacterium lutimaris]